MTLSRLSQFPDWTPKIESRNLVLAHAREHCRDHGLAHDHDHDRDVSNMIACMCKHDISAFNLWGPIWEPKQRRKYLMYGNFPFIHEIANLIKCNLRVFGSNTLITQ